MRATMSVAIGRILATLLLVAGQVAPPALAAGNGSPIISSADAKRYSVKGGLLGIKFGDSEQMRTRSGEPFVCMVLKEVDPMGPAGGARMAPGDHLCAVNGYYFESTDALRRFINGFAPGHVVELTHSRPGRTGAVQSKARLAARDGLSVPFRTLTDLSGAADAGGFLGIEFETTSVEVSTPNHPFGEKSSRFAAKITKFRPGSRVSSAAIVPGDHLSAFQKSQLYDSIGEIGS